MSTKKISITNDFKASWTRSAYDVMLQTKQEFHVSPAKAREIVGVFIHNHLSAATVGFRIDEETIFSPEISERLMHELSSSRDALKGHAPKISAFFNAMLESFSQAFGNSNIFVCSNRSANLDFSRPKQVIRTEGISRKKRLPDTLLDDWRAATLGQMEGDGLEIDTNIEHALTDNLMSVRTAFAHFTKTKFESDEGEAQVISFLNTIESQPHATMAGYMKKAL